MLIDTHCHINITVKGFQNQPEAREFTKDELISINTIINHAQEQDTSTIFNVGTNLIESMDCITLAKLYKNCYAIIGIHPNDATENWRHDMQKLTEFAAAADDHKIIGIGECGIDRHYPGYNLSLQQDVFKAQIELALRYNLGLSIHSRDAAEETYKIIDEYTKESNFRGIMHCYSYDESYAQQAINFGLALGIGGTVTYPKNEVLRTIVKNTDLNNIVLETDAPFLPPQIMRGQVNSPANIKVIAQYIAQIKGTSYEKVAEITSNKAKSLFKLA